VGSFVAVLCLGGVAFAVDGSQRRTISDGVSISGVDVGGLDAEEARGRVERLLAARLARPVVVSAAGQRFRLSTRDAGVQVDYDGAIEQAVSRSRSGWIGSRLWRSVAGRPVGAAITPGVSVNRASVDGFARRVAAKVERKPVEAHLTYGPASVTPTEGTPGLKLSAGALSSTIVSALTAPGGSDPVEVKAPLRTIRPTTSARDLAGRYPTVITVSRASRQLHLFKDLKLVRTFPVAVGMAGLDTPAGLYSIQDKQVNPVWRVPNSDWAGDLAGKTIQPGPSNPIKARWMGVAASVGIHGTADAASLGTAASHGCIRMSVADVTWLYDRVPSGTPVYIS